MTTKLKSFCQNIKDKIVSFFKGCGAWLKYFWLLFLGLFTKKKPERPSPFSAYLKGKEPLPSEAQSADSLEDSTVIFSGTEQLRQLDLAEKQLSAPPQLDSSQLHGRGKQSSILFQPRDRRPLFALGVVITTCKIAGIALIVCIAAAIGAVFGVANAYLGTTPELDLERLSDQDLTSYIYDCNGELITSYAGMENRDYATLDEIPELLQQAVIAVEDVRFYYHNGIDLKRLLGAFIGNVSGSYSSGGSTITQQLIKNQLLSSERSYKRKIQEANLALQLEKKYTKDEILEAYLNTIPLGGTNYGVKAAAKDYFGKDLDELTLREMACLAGITQLPYTYNPRRAYYVTGDTTALNARIKTVLDRMYAAGFITLDEYEEALNDELVVLEKSQVNEMYQMPHFVEYAVTDVITHLLEVRELEDTSANRAAIENELRTGGYQIYTTVDPEIQSTVQTSLAEFDEYPSMQDRSAQTKTEEIGGVSVEIDQPQASAVVLDHSTGYLKAIVGSRTEPTIQKSTNRAYSARQPVGSSIKPISVYGPALDKGCGLGTIIPNIAAPIEGWGENNGHPSVGSSNVGPVTIRTGIVKSLNVVAARTLMDYVGLDDSYDYLLKLGIDSSKLNKDGVGLALGTSGITTIEMAGAYACIANGGTYIEPISFTKILDKDGNTILTAEEVQETRQVFKESTAFMLVDALQSAVKSGTGTNARISNMNVAGKTGTNVEGRVIFFAGITPYYTSTVRIAHDDYLPMRNAYGSRAAKLWKNYMSQILDGMENRSILPGTASDYGVKKYSVCSVSGMKVTDACKADTGGHLPVSDYFAVGTAPTESCNMHSSSGVCTESNMLASEYCPEELVETGGVVVLPKGSPYLYLSDEMLASIFPNLLLQNETCTIHTAEWAAQQEELASLIETAQAAISNAQQFLTEESSRLTFTQISNIQTAIRRVTEAITQETPLADQISAAINQLNTTVDTIRNALPDPEPSPEPSPEPPDTTDDPPEQ